MGNQMTILELNALTNNAIKKVEVDKKIKKASATRTPRVAKVSKYNYVPRVFDEDGVETFESKAISHSGIKVVTPEVFAEVTKLWMEDASATKPEFEFGAQPWTFQNKIEKGKTELRATVDVDATFWNENLAQYYSRDILKKLSDYKLFDMGDILFDSNHPEFTTVVRAAKPAIRSMIANRAQNAGFGLYLEPHEVSSITTNAFDLMMGNDQNMRYFGKDEDGAIFKCIGMFVAKAFSNYVDPYRNDGKALDREMNVNCLFTDPNVGSEWVKQGDHKVAQALAKFLHGKFGTWDIYNDNVVEAYKGRTGAIAAELKKVYKEAIFDESGLQGATIYEIKDAVQMFKEGDESAWRDVDIVEDGQYAIADRDRSNFSDTELATMDKADEIKTPRKAQALRAAAGMVEINPEDHQPVMKPDRSQQVPLEVYVDTRPLHVEK